MHSRRGYELIVRLNARTRLSFVQRSCKSWALDSEIRFRRASWMHASKRDASYPLISIWHRRFLSAMKMFIHETDAVNIVREYSEMKSKRAEEDQIAIFFFFSNRRRKLILQHRAEIHYVWTFALNLTLGSIDRSCNGSFLTKFRGREYFDSVWKGNRRHSDSDFSVENSSLSFSQSEFDWRREKGEIFAVKQNWNSSVLIF